jgi:hypothetical protein
MIYGNPRVVRVNDTTDLIGIRTLVLSKMWQPSRGDISEAEIDAEKPSIPAVSGGLMLVGEQTRQSEGGLRTTWTFQGINGDGKSVTFKDRSNSLDYGFESGFAQVSIQRHPRFMDLLSEYGGYPDNDGGRVLWPPKLEDNKPGGGLSSNSNTGTNPMFGVNEYFQMEGTYRFRYASPTLPGKILASTGTICTALPGQPPPLVEGRNWLMLPVSYRRRGTVFDITEQYWLSGRGGWPEPVYSSFTKSGTRSTGLQSVSIQPVSGL